MSINDIFTRLMAHSENVHNKYKKLMDILFDVLMDKREYENCLASLKEAVANEKKEYGALKGDKSKVAQLLKICTSQRDSNETRRITRKLNQTTIFEKPLNTALIASYYKKIDVKTTNVALISRRIEQLEESKENPELIRSLKIARYSEAYVNPGLEDILYENDFNFSTEIQKNYLFWVAIYGGDSAPKEFEYLFKEQTKNKTLTFLENLLNRADSDFDGINQINLELMLLEMRSWLVQTESTRLILSLQYSIIELRRMFLEKANPTNKNIMTQIIKALEAAIKDKDSLTRVEAIKKQ